MEFIFSKQKRIAVAVADDARNGLFRVAKAVAEDIKNVTGAETVVCKTGEEQEKLQREGYQMIASCYQGTAFSRQVKKWHEEQAQNSEQAAKGNDGQAENKIRNLASIDDKPEVYDFRITTCPVSGEVSLLIYGSDLLGAIYGLFHVSELLGVTAMVDFGDCAPAKQEQVVLTEKDNVVSKVPSVRYRGFFINDEWPCFGNWTSEHFGGFTAEAYDHIFQYLLRMKGNYLWPAMWSSNFMLDGPDMKNQELADEYGIYIGMSHHEPCMRSGAEYGKVRGKNSPYGDDWSYVRNKEGLLKFWEDGIKRSISHQVLPTVGMRGENDSKMLGENSTIEENVRLLKEIIRNQKEMISRYLETDGKKVPKLFAVYKEVEDYFFGGEAQDGLLGSPDLEDVVLLLCDDNHGNMRALPTPEMRSHKGGFGMYYHLDYHGDPISYEWINSTTLMRVWEQMTQAYECGVQTLWIVNVGDVKFQEHSLNYFMDMAYDYETYGISDLKSAEKYGKAWVHKNFGAHVSEEEKAQILEVLSGYLKLANFRRPEALNDQIYHPAYDGEADRLLAECDRLENLNEALYHNLEGKEIGDGYYSVVYFQAAAFLNLLKMHLYSGKNHLYASQGKAVANEYGDRMDACIERDKQLAEDFKSFKDGKWNGMQLASHIGFISWNDFDYRYPVKHTLHLQDTAKLIVSRADDVKCFVRSYFPFPLVIEDFANSEKTSVTLQIANGGKGTLSWKILKGQRIVGGDGVARERKGADFDWLEISGLEGETALQDEITLTLLKEKLPVGEEKEALFEIQAGDHFVPVVVKGLRRDFGKLSKGCCLPNADQIVIDPAGYDHMETSIKDGAKAYFEILNGYGKYETGIKAYPVSSHYNIEETTPKVSYSFYIEKEGEYEVTLHTSPANPLIYHGTLHMAVRIDQGEKEAVTIAAENYRGGEGRCKEWADGVLNMEHKASVEEYLERGEHTITVSPLEAGVVLERITITKKDSQNKKSYFGAKVSARYNM